MTRVVVTGAIRDSGRANRCISVGRSCFTRPVNRNQPGFDVVDLPAVEHAATLETGSDDRVANMHAFAAAADSFRVRYVARLYDLVVG